LLYILGVQLPLEGNKNGLQGILEGHFFREGDENEA
jgi:hypothetical protein